MKHALVIVLAACTLASCAARGNALENYKKETEDFRQFLQMQIIGELEKAKKETVLDAQEFFRSNIASHFWFYQKQCFDLYQEKYKGEFSLETAARETAFNETETRKRLAEIQREKEPKDKIWEEFRKELSRLKQRLQEEINEQLKKTELLLPSLGLDFDTFVMLYIAPKEPKYTKLAAQTFKKYYPQPTQEESQMGTIASKELFDLDFFKAMFAKIQKKKEAGKPHVHEHALDNLSRSLKALALGT